MDDFVDFIIKNFFLLCLTLSVIFLVLRSYRRQVVRPLYPILIVCTSLTLSVVYLIETVAAKNSLFFLATFCCSLGFMLRPMVIFFFICMTMHNKWALRISRVLICINVIPYILALFTFAPALTQGIFYYNGAEVKRGFFFYTCHLIVAIMAGYFIIYTLMQLRGRHKYDAIACLISATFIVIAVVIESYLVAAYLLNTTVAIACLFYIIHLYQQSSVKDALTALYDRKAYYNDLEKIRNKVTGLALIDMNGLKTINDSNGHEAGDIALKTIADVILDTIDFRDMDAYRMGGDEFIILTTTTKDGKLEETVNKIKEKMAQTPYSVAIGFAIRKEDMKIHNLNLLADEMMYKDKTQYYVSHGIERRKNSN